MVSDAMGVEEHRNWSDVDYTKLLNGPVSYTHLTLPTKA